MIPSPVQCLVSNMLISTISQLAKDLLSTFLFPGLSVSNSAGCQSRIPVLKDAVREDLYNLVLSLSKTQEDFENIVDHFDDIVPRGELFVYSEMIQPLLIHIRHVL